MIVNEFIPAEVSAHWSLLRSLEKSGVTFSFLTSAYINLFRKDRDGISDGICRRFFKVV